MSFAKKSLISLLIVSSLCGCTVKKEITKKEIDYKTKAVVVDRINEKEIMARPYELSDLNNKISVVYITDDGGRAYYFDGKNYRELPGKKVQKK